MRKERIWGTTTKTWSYTYDARGNRLTSTVDGATTTRTFNAASQLTSAGYSYDGAGNLTTDPTAGAIVYNQADQIDAVTRSGATYDYVFAGTNQNELISQTTPDGDYAYTYGRTDSVGRPVIESLTRSNAPNANGTAYLENDPVTGQPIILRAASGTRSLYITDANANPVALLNNNATTAVAYAYDPYGADTITTQDGFNASRQNPYLFASGVQDRTTDWVKFGQRFYDPTARPLDPTRHHRRPPGPRQRQPLRLRRLATPSTTSTPPGAMFMLA